ncbi:threonine synthase [Powellomyces hirtus]|nr:threonine synthase [Powellomyces hirtus]
MRYRSTRGTSTDLSFEEAVFEGLAPDGGLYIPHSIPQTPLSEIHQWSNLSFPQLATKIFRKFISHEEISDADLADIVTRSFGTFSTPEVTPLKKLPNVAVGNGNGDLENLYVLELFHGPTFAFKDVALQFLGNLFEFFLERRNRNSATKFGITVLGATSGDTGGAAIYGLRGKKNVDVFILHPEGRISPVQEQQMTSVLDRNVHNVAIEGTFDDCQVMVKAAFSDQKFRRRFHLAAVNSINWARILAQTSYYFYSYFAVLRRIGTPSGASSYAALTKIQYSVPTGNFGDVLAGYYAVRMGLPIDRLIVATNENDILHRFFQSGRYEKKQSRNGSEPVKQTLSPAMDILVSSNFERLLWYLSIEDRRSTNSDADVCAKHASANMVQWMRELRDKGGFTVPETIFNSSKGLFTSFCTSDALTSDAITRYYHHQYTLLHEAPKPYHGAERPALAYVLDPHTAVGVVAAEQLVATSTTPTTSSIKSTHTICLATASPGKFPEAVLKAINENAPALSPQRGFKPLTYADIAPRELVALEGLPKRCLHIQSPGDKLDALFAVIEDNVGAQFPAKPLSKL